MTQPWYPFYWSDYSGKTMHLSMGQHGAYMLFLRWVYTTEKAIPHKQRYSIARAMTEQEQGDADFVLSEFFTRENDEWRSKRAEAVIYETKNRHEKRVNAGKKGGLAKSSNAKEMLEQNESNALVTTTTTTTISNNDKSLLEGAPAADDIKSKSRKGKDNGARLQVWYENSGCEPGRLPVGWGEYPKSKFGWNDREVEHVANAFWRYWTGPDARDPIKKDWGRAWQGWCDRSNSRGEHRVSAQAAHQKPGGLSFNKILSIAEQAASQN